jgi:HEAT repeat protein
MVLATLSNYPEITTPPWPWWPPQYEHTSYLLSHLSQSAQVPLETLLQYPTLSQPPGPVLWTSVIEAANSHSHPGYELLLREGLRSPWATVRYAAAMALARLAGTASLLKQTLEVLHAHLCTGETVPVQLAASYALLLQGDSSSIETLTSLLRCDTSEEARKAAAFVLATAFQSQRPHLVLSLAQHKRLTHLLILSLQDQNEELAGYAACTLGRIAPPSTLPALHTLLDSSQPRVQVAALTALEGMASRTMIRRAIQHYMLPARVVGLLRAEETEVRRQACYTLATFGGEYAMAALGAVILDSDHPGNIEAIEGLRLLHGGLRRPTRTKVMRWLLLALHQPREEVQVTALDSLSYLMQQARTRRQMKTLRKITQEIVLDGTLPRLLSSPSAWVRQRTVELLAIVNRQFCTFQQQLAQLLLSDNDSGVRACIAYHLGQGHVRQAIPALLQALLDADENVAETAFNSLERVAGPNDAIVVYVMKELALYERGGYNINSLAHLARTLLKKWRKRRGESPGPIKGHGLHSSP